MRKMKLKALAQQVIVVTGASSGIGLSTARFGGFDTWVNNAGVSIYGAALDIPLDDMRRLFDTNVWGVVPGSRVALEHLRERGGALINIGSEVADKALPLQGIYSASKHAVKGWTDALRMELEAERAPVSVAPATTAMPSMSLAVDCRNVETTKAWSAAACIPERRCTR